MKQTAALIVIILALASGITAAFLYFRSGEGVQLGENAPEFTLTDTNGNTFSLSDFRGKVVVLDFMATWCGPCEEEISDLKVVQQNFGNDVVIISIDVDTSETIGELETFKDEHGATWRFAIDTANISPEYGVTAIPHLVIIDKNGNVRFTHIGTTSSSTLINEINGLL